MGEPGGLEALDPFADPSNPAEPAQKVLIEIEGGLAESVCAEPAIRAYKASHFRQVEVTVCSRCCDLFRNHPSVANFTAEGDTTLAGEFDVCFTLTGFVQAQCQGIHPVDWYAKQLEVGLPDRAPWLCLDSFDYVRMQRFDIEKLGHPRIAIAGSSDCPDGQWTQEKWNALGGMLEEKLHASVIQLSGQNDQPMEKGLNLIDRLSPREAATVLSCCDLLICMDNGYLDLAAAVQTPYLVLLHHPDPWVRLHREGGYFVQEQDRHAEEISVESVMEEILRFCRSQPKEK
ncbi:MAG: hypothetical protein JW828_14165 [Sedimentisphaerales bacterium]|nr:hypothetical protein [Sedimentisphaerales bacterium]